MDDNAGGYYDQHVYIIHRISNMVVRDIIRQRICNYFDDFHKISTIFSTFCLITQKWDRRKIILSQIDKEMYFEQFHRLLS